MTTPTKEREEALTRMKNEVGLPVDREPLTRAITDPEIAWPGGEAALIEAIAFAAWKSYCGAPTVREEWMDDEDWEESQTPLLAWIEAPNLCTHIGADGFRRIAKDVLAHLRDHLNTTKGE